MTAPSLNLRFLLVFIMPGLSHVDSAVYCPRSLYDCHSLEVGLKYSGDDIINPEFIASDKKENEMEEICRFFESQECYEPVVSKCKGELVYSTRAFRSRQRYICGDRRDRKGANKMGLCVHQVKRHFRKCRQKRQQRLDEVSQLSISSSPSHPWCNLTNDYIVCVYSVMALGCTVEDAEEYMDAVNQSSPVMEAIYGYGCSFGHPLNILKTTTVSPDTTQDERGSGTGNVVYRTGRHPSYGQRRSAGNSLHSYVSGTRHRDVKTVTPSPNNCNTFFPLHGEDNFLFFTQNSVRFPGFTGVLLCCVLGFFLQTFLLRGGSVTFRNSRFNLFQFRSLHGKRVAFNIGKR